jgi:hypothetical protein
MIFANTINLEDKPQENLNEVIISYKSIFLYKKTTFLN